MLSKVAESYSWVNWPGHLVTGALIAADNMLDDNHVADVGALLGHVLYYDKSLSANSTVSCAFFYQQKMALAIQLNSAMDLREIWRLEIRRGLAICDFIRAVISSGMNLRKHLKSRCSNLFKMYMKWASRLKGLMKEWLVFSVTKDYSEMPLTIRR